MLHGDFTAERSVALRFLKMDQITRRYAPLSRDHIPGFPNKIPKVDWSRNLPIFKDDGKKDAALHLVRFHMHIRKFKVDFPEDCLMKIFLATLEGKAQSWYESLPPACINCLKDFHAMFIERYKDSYPSLNLVQDCCKHACSFIESLEKYYEDDNFMDVEIMEALYENPFQQHTEILEDTCQDQQVEDGHMAVNDEREELVSDLPTEDSSMQPIKESSTIEIIDRVLDLDVHEQQGENFVQVSDESPFNNSIINDSLNALSYEDSYCLSKETKRHCLLCLKRR